MEDKLNRLSKESFLAKMELTGEQKRGMIDRIKNHRSSSLNPGFTWYKTSLSIVIFAVLLLVIASIAFQSIKNPNYHGATLTKVEGMGFAYSEYFKVVDQLDQREKGVFYKPLSIKEMLTVLPESMKHAVHPIDPSELPFDANENSAYLVQSKTKEGKVQNEVQFTYLNKAASGFANDFFVLSVTEVDENPLAQYDFSKEKSDTMGNEFRSEILKDNIPLYHQVRTTDSALVYTYYGFEPKEEKVITIATAANEFYTYYNGYVYHVGYSIAGEKNNSALDAEMLRLTREFILGKSHEKINIKMKSEEAQTEMIENFTFDDYKRVLSEAVDEANEFHLEDKALYKWVVRTLADEKLYFETDLTKEQVLQLASQSLEEYKVWRSIAEKKYHLTVSSKEVDNYIKEGPDTSDLPKHLAYAEVLGMTLEELNHNFDRDLYEKNVIWLKLKPKLAEKYGTEENNTLVRKYKKEIQKVLGN